MGAANNTNCKPRLEGLQEGGGGMRGEAHLGIREGLSPSSASRFFPSPERAFAPGCFNVFFHRSAPPPPEGEG